MSEIAPAATKAPELPLPRSVPALLSFVAGYIDIYTFVALFGLFVAQVTGSFVTAGAELVSHDVGITGKVIAIVAFLVGARIAEIGQDAVAAKLREEAIVGSHDTGTRGVIGVHHRAHVLGVEPPRQSGGTHQITDHQGEVAPLCSGWARLSGLQIPCSWVRGARSARAQGRDRPKKPLSIAQRYAELLEIVDRTE